MMKQSGIKGILLTLALLVGMTISAGRAAAQDKVHLKDGRVLDGAVVREVEGYIWFKTKIGSIENTEVFRPDQISKIERAVAASSGDKATASAPAAASTPAEPKNRHTGAPRVAIITLGESGGKDMVGMYMTANALEQAIPLLEEEKVTDVVFRINSGGGALLEIQKLSDVIQNEYKPRFRVVAWIESAISAAAMTAHCIEEIYMMPRGNYGACTGWFGALTAVKGRELEEVLFMMENISARGKHDPKIMRAMQILEPLSCTIDENGEVRWYQNLDGEFIVNREDRILTFNADDAVKYKFAKAKVDSYEELGKAMGYTEVEWVGKNIPGVAYPVCRAEELQRKFRGTTYNDEKRTRQYQTEYGLAIELARATPPADRGKFIAEARNALNKIRAMVKNNPNFALFVFGMLPEDFKDWLAQQEEILRELARK
jgi:hypothetical protein